ncbi:hypothetical protein Dimus_021452 [Dionaea muscipula]
MSTLDDFVDVQPTNPINDLLIIQDQGKMKGVVVEVSEEEEEMRTAADHRHHHGLCVICLDKIVLQETALVKGCEHAYCVTCILHWASYNEHYKCPQCKHPFEALIVHRSLDGSIHDYMFEESVCLLLRATWFKPLDVEPRDDLFDESEELEFYQYQYYEYEDDDDDVDEVYFSSSSSLHIGNRRWGNGGYIRSGRQQARPTNRSNLQDPGAAGSSCEPKMKEANSVPAGRRAKRALKREAADKAAAAKNQHPVNLGRK